MGKDGYSRKGFFGDIIHYDSDGNKLLHSFPNWFAISIIIKIKIAEVII